MGQRGWEDLPTELLEKIAGGVDGRTVAQCRLVSSRLAAVVDARASQLPKIVYRRLCFYWGGPGGLQVQGDTGPEERGLVEPQQRPSLVRSLIRDGRRWTDTITHLADLPHLLRHLDAETLVLENMSPEMGHFFLKLLASHLLGTHNLVVNNCTFDLPRDKDQLLLLLERREELRELSLRNCFAIPYYPRADVLWSVLRQKPHFSILRLQDTAGRERSCWPTNLAEEIFKDAVRNLDELELVGVTLWSMRNLQRRIRCWLEKDPRMATLMAPPVEGVDSVMGSYEALPPVPLHKPSPTVKLSLSHMDILTFNEDLLIDTHVTRVIDINTLSLKLRAYMRKLFPNTRPLPVSINCDLVHSQSFDNVKRQAFNTRQLVICPNIGDDDPPKFLINVPRSLYPEF